MAEKKSTALSGKELLKKLSEDADSIRLLLMYGDEDYIIESAVKTVKKKFLAPGSEDMDLSILDNTNFSADRLLEAVTTPPWLSSKRVVLVKNSNIFSKDTDPDDFKFLKEIPSSSIVVFSESETDKRKRMYKFFKENAVVAEIKKLDAMNLSNWAASRLSKAGIKITEAAVSSLVMRCDMSMRNLASETGKLELYCKGIGVGTVDINVVESVCPPDISGSIFEITDAIGTGNAAKALTTLNSLILLKEPVIKLRVSFMSHIKKLIIAKDLGSKDKLVKKLSLHPYHAENLIKQSRHFTIEQLTDLYLYAAEQDVRIKHGEIDERHSLETTIIKATERK